jgi:hypothetical protein
MSNLYNTLDGSILKKPGQYNLTDVVLVSYRSLRGDNTAEKIGIDTMVVDLNIFESIYNKTLSGNLVIGDAQNIIGKLPLTGNERLEFKLFTPSVPYGYDFSEKSGNPMYIYKITARTGLKPKVQGYVIHFCSKEMIENELKVVSNAPLGTYSDMVADITKNPSFLGSKKNLFLESSIGLHKHVFNRLRPFDSIDQISQLTTSLKYNNAGYYFYETSRGFNYRSLESMLAVEANTARPSIARFRPKPANVSDAKGEKDIKNEMQVVMDYKILDQFDTLKNLRNGVYASKLITHNQLNKTYQETDFNYELEYGKNFHTEINKDGGKENEKGILPKYIREGNSLSEYSESTLYLWPDTTNVHYTEQGNPVAIADAKNIVQKRLSQRLAFQSFKLQLTVNGFTALQAGDIITFEMPSYEPRDGNEPSDYDVYMSGRYLVTSIRHEMNIKLKKHIMVLECMKDSVRKPYPDEFNDTFIDKEKNNEGIIDQYEFDKILLEGIMGKFFK